MTGTTRLLTRFYLRQERRIWLGVTPLTYIILLKRMLRENDRLTTELNRQRLREQEQIGSFGFQGNEHAGADPFAGSCGETNGSSARR